MPDSISRQARQIIQRYDRNQDAKIQYPKPNYTCEETGDRCGVPVDERYRDLGEEGVASRELLFVEADANHDHQVTQQEIEAVMRRYDEDGDGTLSPAEQAAFDRRFGESKLDP